jgi:AcrR family transcriptional regulator
VTARKQRRPRPPRQRLDTGERRAQLLALGLERFARAPYDAVSIDDLAREAGVSKGLLFHYFASKRAFYVAVLRAAADELLTVVAPDQSLPPLERLEQGVEAYLAAVERRGEAYVWLMRSGIGGDVAVHEVVKETRQRFLARVVEELPLGPPPPKLRLLLRGWIGMVEAASVEWVATRSVTREELRALLVKALVDGLSELLVAPQAGAAGPRPRGRRGRA